MQPEETRHRVGDIAVRLLRAGTGDKLLFLHGAAGVPPWSAFFERISAHYQVLMPEHPGFGTAENAASIRNIADLAMYYLDFLDAFEGESVHLVGHSLGGWTAAEVAVRNSSRLKSLSLIAPAGIRVKATPIGDNFIWSPEELVRNLYYDQSFADQVLSHTPSEEETDRLLTNRFMAARLAWEPRWFNPALERWLHRIRIPALAIWGANDKLFPSAYATKWAERIPGLKVNILPECGHIPQVEKADETAKILLAFLEGR